MKNKFIKPEIEILTFHCSAESFDADSFTQDAELGSGVKIRDKYALPNGAQPEQGGVNVPGGDLGVPY
jgi:hypothetical protein